MAVSASLRNVIKSYRRGSQTLQVLQSLSLDVQSGEFLALMGPSGSGKTTLLNLIGGLSRPDAGEVWAAGERIDTLSGRKLTHWRARHVGFVFQFYNLLPALTAAQNIEVPLLLTRVSRGQRRQKVQAALELVGLADRATHKPAELSGGQQQRVAVARALIADPPLLVCDEPTGDLDRAAANEIMSLLQLLSQQHGKTVVMVTHDARAAAYATRRLYLDKGRIDLSGEREQAAA
jgi:putative ABC transport system ATP-binding protein